MHREANYTQVSTLIGVNNYHISTYVLEEENSITKQSRIAFVWACGGVHANIILNGIDALTHTCLTALVTQNGFMEIPIIACYP